MLKYNPVILWFLFVFLMGNVSLLSAQSQASTGKSSQVAIEVLDNQFMNAKGYISSEPTKKMEVKFTPNLVTVKIPNGANSITLEIVNTDCKAFCPKQKRIRQLGVGDEKLLLNLIEERKASILRQIQN